MHVERERRQAGEGDLARLGVGGDGVELAAARIERVAWLKKYCRPRRDGATFRPACAIRRGHFDRDYHCSWISAANRRKALPRWLTRFFSRASSSAAVFCRSGRKK